MNPLLLTALAALTLLASPIAAQSLRLSRVATPALAEHGPERPNAVIGIAPSGTLAFTEGFDPQGRLVTLTDSTGRVLARFGRKGSGPGEFRMILRLFVTDTAVYVFEAARLAAFDLAGAHRWTRALPPTAIVVGLHGDSIDVLASQDPMRSFGLQRLSLRSMRGRSIIPDRGAPLHALTRSGRDSSRSVLPAVTRLGGDLVIGDGLRYRIVRIGADGQPRATFGRDIPQRRLAGDALEAEVQRQLAAARRPYRGPDGQLIRLPVNEAQIRREASGTRAFFSGQTQGLHSDGRRRLYTVIPTGTATFIDLFEHDRFVGRATLACPGRRVPAAGAGPFLLLLCETADAELLDVELKLFRLP